MGSIRELTPALVRGLFLIKQWLADPPVAVDRARIMGLVRDLGCLQLDPINVVARSHLLVLWSRLGRFDPADLDALLWEERRLFEYWAHRASIVMTEDYPIHHLLMRRYPTDRYAHSGRTKAWLRENGGLRRYVLAHLQRSGPVMLRDFEDRSRTGWISGGWTTGRNVERMLDVLWIQGRVAVAGRNGIQKLWDLADRWFPAWTPKDRLSEREIVRRAAQRSLRALGVARAREIDRHFTAGRYPGLPEVLSRLESEGTIERVRVVDDGSEWPGPWFVHGDDVPLLERMRGGWAPRTTLLSPFDNLIIDRDRAELLFGVRLRMEIYVPKSQRRYGYYSLPILQGDRLIGRVDPLMDRRRGRLVVNSVHAEPDAPTGLATARSVGAAVRELARFLGATEIEYGVVPEPWRRGLT